MKKQIFMVMKKIVDEKSMWIKNWFWQTFVEEINGQTERQSERQSEGQTERQTQRR